MAKIFGFSGDADFLRGESIYSNSKQATLFFPLDRRVELYFPPNKKPRVTSHCVFTNDRRQQQQKVSIEVLPDECLFEILRRLPGDQERSTCASVSKRWLNLLSNISRDEQCSRKAELPQKLEDDDDYEVSGIDGCLTRVLEGKKATDTRLAAISVGTAGRGGLGKLVICGGKATDLGLTSISRGCPSLRSLSIWNVPSIGDTGLVEIAKGCRQLEKLELHQCHGISDKGLAALAKGCSNLREVTVQSCPKIGNEWLQALGQHCPNLECVTIKNCPLVGDQGIVGLLSATSCPLLKLKLQSLNLTDISLAVIGHYGNALTDLVLENLPWVTEKGFWVMGNGHGLQKLKSFIVLSCQGVTDLGLEAISRGCPNLKHISVRKCSYLSDTGVIACARSALCLERIELEECHRITQNGFFGLLVYGKKLKAVSVLSCLGIKELELGLVSYIPHCESLLSLSVKNCPFFGNSNLAMLGSMCPKLTHIHLSGLRDITDEGLLPLIKGCDGLTAVNLSKCPNVTDNVVSALSEVHGWTLELLNLDSCNKITSKSLAAIAQNCMVLNDLDVSNSCVSDVGITALSRAKQLDLEILSLSGCCHVTDKSLPALRNLGSTLAGLNIQHCNGISRKGVDSLTERLWMCDILS